MDMLIIVGIFAFIIRIFRKTSHITMLWYRKEYRLDRMRIHLRTKQARGIVWETAHLLMVLGIVAWLFPELHKWTNVYFAVLACGMAVRYLKSVRYWQYPPNSAKVISMYIAVTSIGVVAVGSRIFPVLVTLALLDILLFPVISLLVFLLSVPTILYHRLVIFRAIGTLRNHTGMLVVGITGSYGKTSVKDYLAAIVSARFVTLKTQASKNSPIGIAEVVQRSLDSTHKIFVVEMAAYTRGEISVMTKMVNPRIGILTAINPQHQDLFGSMENTMKAKYELAQGLKGEKILIVNADDPKTREMGGWAIRDGCDVWWYTTAPDSGRSGPVSGRRIFRGSNCIADMTGVAFDCISGKEKVLVHAPVLGVHQVHNILAAMAGAVACGMTLKEAGHAASRIRTAKMVMEPIQGPNGAVYIDDTFNNNPDAAKAAISFLGNHSGRKILVFQPMIELGAFARPAHTEVGSAAARFADAILLTNDTYFSSIEQGVRAVSPSVPLLVMTPGKAAAYLRAHTTRDTMVVFKGKEAGSVLKLLES